MAIKQRWIVCLINPVGGTSVEQAPSLWAAKRALVEYCEATGFGRGLQVTGQYGCSGHLHRWTPEAWKIASTHADKGCQLGYPLRLAENGPRGGVRVVEA